ncbi:MAG: hypothetical protein QNJ22_23045 [Desulfosarcinaceae bacterium]|nr:hypothetical protein [Desulfosarcinaceae bacterium]
MPKKKAINEKALIKAITDKLPQAQVIKKFGFKTSAQMRSAYLTALINTGKAPAIEKSKKKAGAVSTAIKVGKRGSLIVPKALVESFGYKEGDTFAVKSTKAGIRLVKA